MTMNKLKPRILLLTTNFGFGGAERSFAELSKVLADHYTVFVAVFNKESNYGGGYHHAGRVIDMKVKAGRGFLGKVISFFNRIVKLRKIKEDKKIDLTISFLEGADYINLLSGGKDKKIISIRGSKKYDQNIRGAVGLIRKKILIPFLYNRADHIITLNEGIAYELQNHFRLSSKISVTTIYNFFDLAELKRRAEEPLTVQEEKAFNGCVLISHGRLAKEKGFDYLIRMFCQIKTVNSACRLFIIGDGVEKNNLENICRQEGLSYGDFKDEGADGWDVVFWGYRENPIKYLSRAQLFICSSLTEGFGNSIVEAMAANIPVMAADCPWGPRSILNGIERQKGPYIAITEPEYTDCGVLMPMLNDPGKFTPWVAVLEKFLKDKELSQRIVNGANKRLVTFSKDRLSLKWLSIINQYAPTQKLYQEELSD
jgi:glycosyltransferase involved in cell wall biosynthesis